MHGLKKLLLAAVVAFAPARLPAQSTDSSSQSAVDQAKVDRAMERVRAKQAAGPSVDDRLHELERRMSKFEVEQDKRVAELEKRLAAANQQIEELQGKLNAPLRDQAKGDAAPKRKAAAGTSTAERSREALDRARSKLASHLKSLQDAKDRLASLERDVASGRKPNTSIDNARGNVAMLERWVAQDQSEIARLESAQP